MTVSRLAGAKYRASTSGARTQSGLERKKAPETNSPCPRILEYWYLTFDL